MLLDRTDQAISSTDLQKNTRKILDRIADGSQDRYVVMRDNKPTAVMIAAERYEALMDYLEDMRIDALAAERLAANPNPKYITSEEMDKFIEDMD